MAVVVYRLLYLPETCKVYLSDGSARIIITIIMSVFLERLSM